MTLDLQDEHRIEIESAIRTFHLIEAVRLVRRHAGVGLREAVDYIDELKQQLVPLSSQHDYDNTWGWVYAIGRFRSDLVECLSYPAKFYENVQNGAIVVTVLFETSAWRGVEALARSFQIDPWDFNQHKLVPGNLSEEVIWDELYGGPTVTDLTGLWSAYDREIRRFTALRDANFDFYFCMEYPGLGDEI